MNEPSNDKSSQSQSCATSDSTAVSIRSQQLMSRDTAALLVIDVQEKLLPHIQGHDSVLWNIRRLVDGASILGVPTMCTEQYPKGLGHTVSLLAERVSVDDEKALFSCRDCQNTLARLQRDQRHQVVLCGIETHVCVQQTAFDLIAAGYDVWLAVDAAGSRFPLDHQTALQRMEANGVSLTTVESALFEWCEVSGTREFKRISSLVRETPPATSPGFDSRYFPKLPPHYVVQSNHRESTQPDGRVKIDLHFLVRSTSSGNVVLEFKGDQLHSPPSESAANPLIDKTGVQSAQATPDGTVVNVQMADESIESHYLPTGDARTNHPRWKIRKSERHIASEQFQTDYQITFSVIDHATDDTFRQFIGYEHRLPDGKGLSHASGVRHLEISSDGRWIIVTEVGRPPELIQLPAEIQ